MSGLSGQIESGKRAGISTDTAEKLKALERENGELRQANSMSRSNTPNA
jgi:transposase